MTSDIDVPVVKRSSRTDPLKRMRVVGQSGTTEQSSQLFYVGPREWFFAGIGAQPVNRAANINDRFVERVPQTVRGVAADNQSPRLGHKGRHVPHAAPDDDIETLKRDPAT
jgi:hypothetical protein